MPASALTGRRALSGISWAAFDVAQKFLAGETPHGLAKRYDLSRNLIRIWVQRLEAGVLDEDAVAPAELAGVAQPGRARVGEAQRRWSVRRGS